MVSTISLAKWSTEGPSDNMSAVDWTSLFREYSNALIDHNKKIPYGQPRNSYEDENEDKLLLYFRNQAISAFSNLKDSIAKERMCALLFEYTSGISNIEQLTSLCQRENLSVANIFDACKPESNLYRSLLTNQLCWNSFTKVQLSDASSKYTQLTNAFVDVTDPFCQLCATIPPDKRVEFFNTCLQTYVASHWIYDNDPSYGSGQRNVNAANTLASIWGINPAQLIALAIRNLNTSSSSLLRYCSKSSDDLDTSIISYYLVDLRHIWSFSHHPKDLLASHAFKDYPYNSDTSIDTVAAMMYAAQPEFILCTLNEVFDQQNLEQYTIPENVIY